MALYQALRDGLSPEVHGLPPGDPLWFPRIEGDTIILTWGDTIAVSTVRDALRAFFDAYTDVFPAGLNVQVVVVGRAFSIHISYEQYVRNVAAGESWYAPTWRDGSTGTHGGDAGYILQAVSEHVDRFIVEYLRVNESACGGP